MNDKPNSDSMEAFNHLKSLEKIITDLTESRKDLRLKNNKINNNYRILEEKYEKVLNENKSLIEKCEQLSHKVMKQNVDKRDIECQTDVTCFDTSFDDIEEDYQPFDDKTVMEAYKTCDILCNDSSEELQFKMSESDDNQPIDESIEEIPDSLDNSIDNRERNECNFDDFQSGDELKNGLVSIGSKCNFNVKIETVSNERQNDKTIDENVRIDAICGKSNDKPIEVKKEVNNSTKTNGKSSPLKLVTKTLGPTVRNKNERKQLNGFTCKECEDYYNTRNLTEDELKNRLKTCSRHRSKWSPVKSPEHFWETDFPSTPECIKRGILLIDNNSTPFVTQRKRRLNK